MKVRLAGDPGGRVLRLAAALLLSGCNCSQDKVSYSISVTPPEATISAGATTQLTARITDNRGAAYAGTPAWSSSNAPAAVVSASGLVTGVVAGTAAVTASFQGASASSQITVTAPVTYAVAVTPGTASVAVGSTVPLTAVITDDHGKVVTATPLWASTSAAVASVDAAGLVTGVAPGSAAVTASYGGASGTAQITVTRAAASGSLDCIDPPALAVGADLRSFTLFGAGLTSGSVVQLDGAAVHTVYAGPTADHAATLEGVLAAADVAAPRTGQVTVALAGAGGTTNALPLGVRAQPAGYPLLVSAAPDGGTTGNPVQSSAVASGNGRYVLFTSGASDVLPGVTEANQQVDAYLRDTCRGVAGPCTPSTRLVSTADGGHVTGARAADQIAISADGRYAAFAAGALLPGVPNQSNLFWRDTCAGTDGGCTPSTALVSVAPDGGPGDGDSRSPALSPDGRFVAFVSTAQNLAAYTGVNRGDVFLRDTCLGAPSGCTPQTLRVSVALDGGFADQQSSAPSVGAGGRYVAFSSDATDLVPGDTNDAPDLFVRDTCLGAAGCTPSTTRVSVAVDGGEPDNGSSGAAISADGRFLAFQSAATNLIVDDQNGEDDVFLADTCAGKSGCTRSISLVSRSSCGSHFGEASRYPSISSDGRYVGFLTYSTTNEYATVRDTCAGVSGCTPATMVYGVPAGNAQPAICGDGRCFVYPFVAPDFTGQVYLGPSFLLPSVP